MRVRFTHKGIRYVGTVDDENIWDVGDTPEAHVAAAFARDMAVAMVTEGYLIHQQNRWASAVVQYAHRGDFEFAQRVPEYPHIIGREY